MKPKQILEANPTASLDELVKLCKNTVSREYIRKLRSKLGLPPYKVTSQNQTLSTEAELERDVRISSITQKSKKTDAKYRLLQKRLEEAETARDLVKKIEDVTTFEIKTTKSSVGEATAVVLASDWHSEETVRGEAVDGLNEFNLQIAEERIQTFFVSVAKLVQTKQQSIKVETLVLALLGDFITGNIHEEIDTVLDPAEAIINVQNQIASGIEYLLEKTNVNLLIPCHSGNHGRATKTIHQGNEHANSFEYLMYHTLANYFHGNKRVKFLIAKGYHSYLDIAGFKIRFSHGHNIKYSGGVGGIYISGNKAIAQWNKSRPVDLDCWGHFHQLRFTGNMICNGSLIGYNAYALAIKADFEKPKQAFFLVNHGRKEITDICPVWLQ
jgi:hypothetical protein